jgi:paraquat-inducible protein B
VKAKVSPATVGMFVLGALALFVIGFLSFGGSNVFKKPSRFLVNFDESVSGLDPGAPVKFYGVRVGRVAAVNVHYDSATKKAVVQTVCEMNRNVVTDSEGAMIDLTDPGIFEEFIRRGLRARLSLTGITGLLFVELTIEDPAQHPAGVPRTNGTDLPVVPSIPSPIAEVQSSIVEIVANLKKVDFGGLAAEFKTLLATTNRKISDFDAEALAASVRQAAEAAENFVKSPEAKSALENLNGALAEVRATLAKIDGQVEPVSGELKKTLADAQASLEQISAAANATQQFVAQQGSVGDEVTRALRQVADTAAALERLADALGRNPNSILVGTKKDWEEAKR